jgi:hypothetical protein
MEIKLAALFEGKKYHSHIGDGDLENQIRHFCIVGLEFRKFKTLDYNQLKIILSLFGFKFSIMFTKVYKIRKTTLVKEKK